MQLIFPKCNKINDKGLNLSRLEQLTRQTINKTVTLIRGQLFKHYAVPDGAVLNP
ncbi:hypothetical protein GARC_3375 [Paraglaciecola arctica BSs20135]|uniref:Uncharacterized protein n=1 Tax=Paraglaciecola arctica BSs20135 TaxID=493475 RepID=K6YUG4_9ALTE|nr:hypothetical protein GARC_3375 [Paraglaciecola arctica BSs20135]